MNVRNKTLERRRWLCRDLVRSDCNLCGSAHFVRLAEENALPIVRCQDCGLVYVNPRPSDRELLMFYEQYLRPQVSDLGKIATDKLFRTDAKRIEGYCRRGRILDIGCGYGFFLHLMKTRGWEVHGSDLSRVGVRHAREKLGLTHVKWGQFQDQRFRDEHFDAVTLWYVLHHVSDPKKVLEKARGALKKQGIIAIRLPNIGLFEVLWYLKKFDCGALRTLLRTLRKQTADPRAPYNVLDPPVHLYAFSPRVLQQLLERAGFSVIGTYNDGMVSRGNILNRVVDGTITRAAEWIKHMTRARVDLSISFSMYARKV